MRIGTAQSQHQTFRRFTLAVLGHCTITRQAADAYIGDIAHAYRNTAAVRNDDIAHIIQRLDGALHPHHQHFLACSQTSGAVVAVVHLQCLLQIGQTHAARGELCIIRRHLESTHQSAQRIDIRHTWQGAQLRANHPIQQRATLGERELAAFHREHIHLTQRRGDRRQAARRPDWQTGLDVAEAFRHLLARPVNVGAILEINGDIRQRVLGNGAQHMLFWNAQHFRFDGRNNPRLHLFRGHAGRLHDQLHLGRGDIGKSVDRQVLERHGARTDQQQREYCDQQALGQRKFDEFI